MSSEYGWSTQDILSTPLFEINWRIRAIFKRMNEKMKLEYKLHGFEVKEKDNTPVKLTEDQEKDMQEALKIAIARKKKEHGKPINDNN